ncbi:MAG: hypothetical protein QNK89_03260 [Lacinutrix sp.]
MSFLIVLKSLTIENNIIDGIEVKKAIIQYNTLKVVLSIKNKQKKR